jgi:hypothetical protein
MTFDDDHRPRAGIAAEYLTGAGVATIFTAVGSVCVANVSLVHGGEGRIRLDALGYGLLVAAPAATAYGTYVVGTYTAETRSFWATLAGSYAGALAGGGLFYATLQMRRSLGNEAHCLAGIVAPFIVAAGAVLGYNLSEPCPSCSDSWTRRLVPPRLDLAGADSGDGVAVDLRALSLRF